MRYSLFLCAIVLVATFSKQAHAGPLSLLIPDDARAFGFDERLGTHLTQSLAPESLALHPSALTQFETLPTTLELRGRREFTFRRTRQTPSELTRVASKGVRLSAAGALGESGWRFALSGAPSERELYAQTRANAGTDGNFDTFVLGFAKRLNPHETLGVSLSHQRVNLPLDVEPLDLGELLPNVSRFDGGFKETRAALEWQRDLSPSSTVRLRTGVLATSAGLDVQSPISNRAAQVDLSTTGFELGARWVSGHRSGKEWVLEVNGERRSDTSPLRLDDETILGRGSGKLEQGAISLFRRGYSRRGAWSLGIEHFGGHGDLELGADAGPLFPSNPLGGLGRANGRVDVRWRATLLRVGRVQQVSKRLQLRGGVAAGEVAASLRANARAFVLLPVLGQSVSYTGELGPRLGVIPSLGLSYGVGRLQLNAQVSQFIPLPESGSGVPSPPPLPGTTRAKSFGGTLASIGVQVRF